MLIELCIGYPPALTRLIGHPVIWIGSLIGGLERLLNRPLPAGTKKASGGETERQIAGIVTLVIVLAVVGAVAVILQHALLHRSVGFLIAAIIASTLLAQRSLHRHVADVACALEDDGLAAARAAVSHIVGRDTENLDEAGVARAAIESLAENFSDAVVAPVFWMAVAGLPGAALYKAINTADSMIGHRTERYLLFGWASARLDDLVNLPASRLAALLLIVASLPDSGAAAAAWHAVWRDARHHRSPNAGYPEAAMAGALGLALAGPRIYGGVRVEDAMMGDGRRDAGAADIRRALMLYRRADAVLIALLAIMTALIIWPV
jgi:adenosylcobinamide-phosphate synthase